MSDDTPAWDHDGIPPPPPLLPQPRHGGNGRLMSPRNQKDRDVWAAERHVKDNWTFQQIADALQVASRGRAYNCVQRGLRITGAPTEQAASEVRAIHRARLELATEAALQILETAHVTVSNGQIVRLDGEPLPDDVPVLQAIDRIVKISESLRKLDGIDAPAKVEHSGGVSYEIVGVDPTDLR